MWWNGERILSMEDKGIRNLWEGLGIGLGFVGVGIFVYLFLIGIAKIAHGG